MVGNCCINTKILHESVLKKMQNLKKVKWDRNYYI